MSSLFTCASKLNEFAGDNFEFDENGRKFSKRVEKNCGKWRNCLLRAISPFLAVLSKELYCRHVKNQGLFGNGLNNSNKKYLPFQNHEETKTLKKSFNPFPKNKILNWIKLKAFADDKLNFAKMTISLFDRVENTVGKGEIMLVTSVLSFSHCVFHCSLLL